MYKLELRQKTTIRKQESINMESITVNGVDYTSDQYGSVYKFSNGAWWHIGKLNDMTLAEAVEYYESN